MAGQIAQYQDYALMVKLPQYKGREHSYIKHFILEHYLGQLFMILGQRHQVIRYVDCFAGPWQTGDPGLQDTSIGISISQMDKCRNALASMKRRKRPVDFKALYIEKDQASFMRLKTFLEGQQESAVAAECARGDFVNLIPRILEWTKNDFTFFFVDPKGYMEILPSVLQPLLRRCNSEFLITFMYSFLNRAYDQQSDLGERLRDELVVSEELRQQDPDERERKLLGAYKAKLRLISSDTGHPYIGNQEILHATHYRTWYHLVYVSGHPLGMIKFAETSEKMATLQAKTRVDTSFRKRAEKSRVEDMFGAAANGMSFVNRPVTDKVVNYWLGRLATEPRRFGRVELARMLEETGWFVTDLQAGFKHLRDKGLAKNIDYQGTRRYKNPVKFEANKGRGERLVKV